MLKELTMVQRWLLENIKTISGALGTKNSTVPLWVCYLLIPYGFGGSSLSPQKILAALIRNGNLHQSSGSITIIDFPKTKKRMVIPKVYLPRGWLMAIVEAYKNGEVLNDLPREKDGPLSTKRRGAQKRKDGLPTKDEQKVKALMEVSPKDTGRRGSRQKTSKLLLEE